MAKNRRGFRRKLEQTFDDAKALDARVASMLTAFRDGLEGMRGLTGEIARFVVRAQGLADADGHMGPEELRAWAGRFDQHTKRLTPVFVKIAAAGRRARPARDAIRG